MRIVSLALGVLLLAACSSKATGTGSSGGTSGSSGRSSSGASGTSGSSGDTTSGSSGTSGTSGGGTCTSHVELVGPSWSASCSEWLDANCCAEEQVCADDAQCVALVSCIDACNGADSCINSSCSGYPQSAMDGIDAIGTCTKQSGSTIPSSCKWPN